MIPTEDVVKDIINMEIDTVYKAYRLLKRDLDIEKEYMKVRYGFNIAFDINYYLNEMYKVSMKKKLIRIQGVNYPLKEFWSEIELREDTMRNTLIENAESVDDLESR